MTFEILYRTRHAGERGHDLGNDRDVTILIESTNARINGMMG